MLERWSHYAALPLRIVLGCSFVVLGVQKLAGYFAESAGREAAGGHQFGCPGESWPVEGRLRGFRDDEPPPRKAAG